MSEIVFALLKLALGLVFFLFGMEVMSGNLEKMAGGKLELMLKKATSNPAKSLLLGAGITIAIQSSSATTVMLVGLVNSGIMNFTQTLHVIFGANIGTTLTPWILSLSGIEGENLLLSMLKPENFSAVLAFIGIMMNMISKKDSRKSIGTIFVGFAVLMYGMELMKEAVSPLSEQPWFTDLMVKFQNPILYSYGYYHHSCYTKFCGIGWYFASLGYENTNYLRYGYSYRYGPKHWYLYYGDYLLYWC